MIISEVTIYDVRKQFVKIIVFCAVGFIHVYLMARLTKGQKEFTSAPQIIAACVLTISMFTLFYYIMTYEFS